MSSGPMWAEWLLAGLCAWLWVLPMDAPSIVICLGLLLVLIYRGKSGWEALGSRSIRSPQAWFFWAGSCYLLVSLVQSLLSPYWVRGLEEWVRHATIFLLFTGLEGRSGRFRELVDLVLRGTSLLAVAIVFDQVLIHPGSQPLSWAFTEGQTPLFPRGYGQFLDPNVCGAFLVVSLALGLKQNRHPLELLFLMSGVVLTQSRGAVLGLLVVFGLFSLLRQHRRFCMAAIFMLLGSFWAIGRAKTLVHEDLGVNQRVELIRGCLSMIQAKPLNGFGPGSFHLFYPSYRTVGGYYPAYAHNHVLELAIEQGVWGAVPWLMAALALGLWLYRRSREGLILLMGVLVMSSVGHAYSMFPFCLQLVLVLVLMTPIRGDGVRKSSSAVKGMAVFLLLFLIFETGRIRLQIQGEIVDTLQVPAGQELLFYDPVIAESLLGRQDSRGKWDKDGLEAGLQYTSVLRHLLPEEANIIFWQARILEESQQTSLAQALYDQALHFNPFSEKITWYRLRLALKREQIDIFWPLFSHILKGNPDYSAINPWYDRIRILGLVMTLKQEGPDSGLKFFEAQDWADEASARELLIEALEYEK